MNKQEPIITYEFGVLSDEKHRVNATNEKSIPFKSFENLWNFVLENQGSPDFGDAMSLHSKGGRRYIKIGRYVGTIQTRDGLTIEILPKIYTSNGNNEDNADLCRRVFLQMLSSFYDTKAKTFQDAQLDTHKNFPILEAYISRYISEVEKLFVSGIKKNYIFVEENQKFLKGKLLVHRQVCKNCVDKSRFIVKYLEYSEDIPQNRIIVSTLHKLANICRCYTLLNMLSDISPSKNVSGDLNSSLNSNRLFSEYKNLIQWSSQFLLNKGFTVFSGNYVNQSLLFSAERLFESFIASLFKKYAKPASVFAQHSKYFLVDKSGNNETNRFRLRPDIVIEKNSPNIYEYQVSIIDTKWKNLDSELPNKDYLIDIKDMYQLFAYGQKYHLGESYILDTIPNLIMIYPYTEKFKSKLEPFSYESVKEKYGLKLTVFPFNLADFKNDGYKRQIEEILAVTSVRALINSSNSQETSQVFNSESDISETDLLKLQDKYMLIGFYKSKEHLKWILDNKLYNVRYDGKREGTLKGLDAHIVPSRIVLYNDLNKKLLVFTVNQSGIIIADRDKMESLNYPKTNPNKEIGERYKLFSLGTQIKSFKKIDILKLKTENQMKADNYAPFFVRY